jgi:acetylornithine deacetylase/succinyl-diaminopimelate desuccinylase-like protein
MSFLRVLTPALLMTLATTSLTAQEPDWNAASKETLAHLQTMIRLNTVNPPGNEMQVAKFLDSTLKAAGIETHLFEPAPGRAAFVARLEGNGSKQPVLIMGHMDVVGIERSHWTVDPFGAEVKGRVPVWPRRDRRQGDARSESRDDAAAEAERDR